MRTEEFLGACLAVVLGICGLVQAQTSKPGTGTVAGQVTCEDTQKPARFAQVMLYEVPSSIAPLQMTGSADPKSRTAMDAQIREITSRTLVQTQTGMDGSFVVQDVPPGDYYVLASVAGYVQPRYLLQAAYDAGEDVLHGVTGVPVIHVSADHATEAGVGVNRGAAVEGHLIWDDGAPVNGAYVQAEPTTKNHKELPPQFSMINMGLGNVIALTDDRGRYRLSGLAPGEYRVRVSLQMGNLMVMVKGSVSMNSMNRTMPLVVYAPAAFRQRDAKPVKLSAGEERGDEDITFNVSGTHTVSGRVTSAEDHHVINRAQVQLRDETDKTFIRGAGVDNEGNFNVAFVPPGTYTLEASGADTAAQPDEKGQGMVVQDKVVRAYARSKQQVIVTDNDVTGQNVELKPMKEDQNEQAGDGGQQHGVVVGTGH